MRVDAYNQVSMVYKAAGKTQTKKVTRSSETEDKIEISQSGKDYQVAKTAVAAAPDVREDKVAELKARYSSGRYNVSADKFAQKLIDKYNAAIY